MARGIKFLDLLGITSVINRLVRTNTTFEVDEDDVQTVNNHIVETFWKDETINNVSIVANIAWLKITPGSPILKPYRTDEKLFTTFKSGDFVTCLNTSHIKKRQLHELSDYGDAILPEATIIKNIVYNAENPEESYIELSNPIDFSYTIGTHEAFIIGGNVSTYMDIYYREKEYPYMVLKNIPISVNNLIFDFKFYGFSYDDAIRAAYNSDFMVKIYFNIVGIKFNEAVTDGTYFKVLLSQGVALRNSDYINYSPAADEFIMPVLTNDIIPFAQSVFESIEPDGSHVDAGTAIFADENKYIRTTKYFYLNFLYFNNKIQCNKLRYLGYA